MVGQVVAAVEAAVESSRDEAAKARENALLEELSIVRAREEEMRVLRVKEVRPWLSRRTRARPR